MNGTTSLKIQFWTRNKASRLYDFILMKPFMAALRVLNRLMPYPDAHGVFENTIYTFRLDRRVDRVLNRLLRFASWGHDFISGVSDWKSAFGEVLSSDQNTKFIGLKTGDSHTHIGMKGKTSSNGSHGVDWLMFMSVEELGTFRMIERKERGNQYEAHCVWLSGKFSGKKFILGEVQTLDDVRRKSSDETIPDKIFCHSPAVTLVTSLLALLGVGNLLEFIGLLSKIKPILSGLFNK